MIFIKESEESGDDSDAAPPPPAKKRGPKPGAKAARKVNISIGNH